MDKKDMQKLLSIPKRSYDYWVLMAGTVCDMFVYPDLWDRTHVDGDDFTGIEIDTVISYAMSNGVSGVAYSKKLGRWVCGRLNWADVPNDNGIAKKCVLNGVSWAEEFPLDKIAFFRNNYFQSPENQLIWFARQFADTDTAQKALIRHSRYTPMPVASTDQEKREYEGALQRNINGEDITVIVRPLSNPLLSQNGQRTEENDRILNLSDPTMIEKMHFLSEYHAELKKRFAALYGMCFKNSSKSAQESVDEVHSMDNFSLIQPFLKLKSLKEFADQCKRKFGWAGSETVDFSELWKREDASAKQADEDEEPAARFDDETELETEEDENGDTSGDS